MSFRARFLCLRLSNSGSTGQRNRLIPQFRPEHCRESCVGRERAGPGVLVGTRWTRRLVGTRWTRRLVGEARSNCESFVSSFSVAGEHVDGELEKVLTADFVVAGDDDFGVGKGLPDTLDCAGPGRG